MKTIVLLLAVNAILLFSCQQGNTKTEEATHEHTSAQHKEPHTGEDATETKKWMTDENTRTYVAEMDTRLKEFKLKNDGELASFKALGGGLSDDLNKLIAGCKMKGPDHDALHGWLTPLLEEVSAVKKSETIAQGQLSVKKIEDIVLDFYERFE
ncbi:hypothetical protein B0I27_11034 [Arcticibacter pallidicorallinus]|uniref:Cytochrome b562 n=1 Tax=Arcticibacter pallidicorallinus TaxID=1259464 RepID=A0A2T0TW44_9SPHI|nr:hypothetical protein [Arcticibacter pallidicorallinus]PRY49860.1 hypothetical protein B0I27_11034 [Arcticibacter pallidicorallinus]